MVGVAYMVILFCCISGLVHCGAQQCPSSCGCLGDFVDCSNKGLKNITGNIPTWATSLDFQRNRIQSIKPLSFQSLKKLRKLKLRHNNISVLQDGTFFGLSKLKILSLDENYIQKIRKSWLYGLDSLQNLYLSSNEIHEIDSDAWECCPKLRRLDLSSNRLYTIKKSTFFKLSNLLVLNLNNNSINYLDDSAFSNTPKLKTLHLSLNQIHLTIEDATGVFRGLSNLVNFYIASNGIKSIKKNAFAGLNKLVVLDLNDNNITSIQKNAFSEMPLLKNLTINTVSLICDCNLHWFYNWLKGGKKLTKESRLICAYPQGLQNQSLLTVSADNSSCDNFVKPRLIEEPAAEIMALKGENVNLTCKAISSSSTVMKFLWKKDGKDIPETTLANRTNGKNIEYLSILSLPNVQQSDTGKYQCIVSNGFGTVYSQKCSISVLIFPQFTKVPKNVTTQIEESFKLECGATGEPKPEIAWQKDGGSDFPAAKERRMQVEDDVFIFLHVKPIDMGVYSCIAHNPAGTIISNATVVVQKMPYFSKQMEDNEITAGESAVLKCMAGGIPKPSVEWLKDGEPLRPTERHFFTAEDQLMIIIDTVSKDAGTYQCVLKNSLGTSNGTSVLVVKPSMVSKNSEPTSDKKAIIITVVCCAVATSIIWIVIIYRAKKRKGSSNLGPAQQDPMIIEFTENVPHFADNTSEHSSCKDSGTGDSAKRSNDDLLPENEFTLIIDNVNTVDAPTTMRAASLVYVPSDANTSHIPLLHSDCPTYPRSTNHDRRPECQSEMVIIEKYPTEKSTQG